MNTGIRKQQKVAINGLVYFYTVQPVTISNVLGQDAATLMEYNIKGNAGDTMQLYKTTEGSWYEMKQSDSKLKNAIIQSLKAAIDHFETSGSVD